MHRPALVTTALVVALAILAGACSSEPSVAADPAPDQPSERQPEPGASQDDVAEPAPEDAEPAPADASDDPDPESERDHDHLHGAWVHLFDDALKTRAGIAATVDELADAGATAVVAQVVRRHDAYYASDVLPGTADPQLEPGLDVLAELLEQAHARGLQVHAWLSVAPTWHDAYQELPAPAGWIATTHGHLADEADRWVTRSVDGSWSQYLDPALPEVRAHVVAVVTELVDRYAVDGIHLDYVRYESERHGYHPRVVQAYLDDSGANATPEPEDPRWSQWRRDRTRELIAEVAAVLDERAGDVLLSAAVISWGPGPGHPDAPTFADTRAVTQALQDWEGWARDGLVDAVMPMHYFREHEPEQADWFASWLAFDATLAGEVGTWLVPGIGGWLNTPEATLDQALRARRAGDGVLVYSFQQPTEDGARAVWQELRDAGWGTSVP